MNLPGSWRSWLCPGRPRRSRRPARPVRPEPSWSSRRGCPRKRCPGRSGADLLRICKVKFWRNFKKQIINTGTFLTVLKIRKRTDRPSWWRTPLRWGPCPRAWSGSKTPRRRRTFKQVRIQKSGMGVASSERSFPPPFKSNFIQFFPFFSHCSENCIRVPDPVPMFEKGQIRSEDQD